MAFCTNCGAPVAGKFCGECGTKVETGSVEKENINFQITPPAKKSYEGLKIIGFKYHRVGMSMGKYLTAVCRDDGFDIVESSNNIPWKEIDIKAGFMGIGMMGMMSPMMGMTQMPMMGMQQLQTNTLQANTPEAATAEISFPTTEDIYSFGGVASIVRVSEEEAEQFFDSLRTLGIYNWDGFSASNPLPPGMHDGQDVFSLAILFEDGSVLDATGSNAYPEKYREIQDVIYKFFVKNQDYSKYYPKEFPEEQPQNLIIKIGSDSPNRFCASVDLHNNMKRWSISLKDNQKAFISEDIFISDAGSADEELLKPQYERFVNLLRKHDMGKLNQTMEGPVVSSDSEEMSMAISYSEERSYRVMMNANIEQYKAFIMDFIDEVKLSYEELKSTSFIK